MWRHLVTLSALVGTVWGHGRVLEPPSRASMWRAGYPTAPNYDDDGVNCGGYSMQWEFNRGRCGICGDGYHIAPPRPHELGGVYGQGIIVGHYLPGSLITVTVDLTASHRGFWEFKLCPDPNINEQYCFDKHTLELEDGGTKYYPTRGSAKYNVTYRLPQGLVCDHCVLQWRYTAGNNWGDCRNGTSALGCGNQEQFGACSDISIGVSNDREKEFTELNQIPYPLFYYLKHGYFDVQQGLLHLLRKGYVRPSDQDQGHTRLTDQERTKGRKNRHNMRDQGSNRLTEHDLDKTRTKLTDQGPDTMHIWPDQGHDKAQTGPTDQGRTELNDQGRTKLIDQERARLIDQERARLIDQERARLNDQGHEKARSRPIDQGRTKSTYQGHEKMRIKAVDQAWDKTRSKLRYKKNKKGRRKKKRRGKSGRKDKPRKRKKVTYEYWR